ncbi:MAG: hypothetical protein J1F12_04775 [Muribaculaceae bacterium]|nr:hypothetical protein [Muribaculaceae bacterium]
MKTLKIRFEDFNWSLFVKADIENFFVEILKIKYNVIILKDGGEEPDVLIYSWLGSNNLKWRNCIRIYYTMEMDYPDFNSCDYAIGLSNIYLEDRFFHLPLYIFYNDLLRKFENINNLHDKKEAITRNFCSIVVSNYTYRDQIFKTIYNKLNLYKQIDSGGKWNNNIGGPVKDKIEFLKKYKFNLAIENYYQNGYVTEKIIESFIAGSIPIYWGHEYVKKEFGDKGFIYINDYDNLEKAIEHIKEIDNNDELYYSILNERIKLQLTYNEWCEALHKFLCNAINKGKRCNHKMMHGRMYYERDMYFKIRESIPGKIYRKYKRFSYKFYDIYKKLI